MKLMLWTTALLGVASLFATACTEGGDSPCEEDASFCDSSLNIAGPTYGIDPQGRVLLSADLAWPNRPVEPPALTARETAEACVVLAACMGFEDEWTSGAQSRLAYASLCATSNPYEERVIPLGSNYLFSSEASDFLRGSTRAAERWVTFARQVTQSGGDCTAVRKILTPRPEEVVCEEAGCWWYSTENPIPDVQCEGDVAVMTSGNRTERRDCSRAFLECDSQSPTGCTDRAPVACVHPAKDRCDGNVKLGCDRFGRASFRDCARVAGGRCVESDEGARCEYAAAESCPLEKAHCAGTKLSICAVNEQVEVDCVGLGLSGCEERDGVATCASL